MSCRRIAFGRHDQVVAVELHEVEAALIEVRAAEGRHDLRVGRIADVDDGDVLGVGHVGQVCRSGRRWSPRRRSARCPGAFDCPRSVCW